MRLVLIPQYSVRHHSMDILSCSLKCGTSQEAGLFLSWQNYLGISTIIEKSPRVLAINMIYTE